MQVRSAQPLDLEALADLWYAAWNDGHATVVPPALVRLRTRDSFKERLQAELDRVSVVGPLGSPLGFAWVKLDELYQLFVSKEARGSGVARVLLEAAEAELGAAGVHIAWLACAIGNERAARFYEKWGWRRVGNMINRLHTPEGEFLLEVWRFEKRLE